MKKTYLNPVVHVAELEEADIVTQSPGDVAAVSLGSEADTGNSDKGRERNSIWDD